MLRDAERAKFDVVTCFNPALRVAGDVRTILSKKTQGNGPMLGNAIASPPERHVIHRLVAALKTRRPGEPHPYVVGPDAVQRYITTVDECAKDGIEIVTDAGYEVAAYKWTRFKDTFIFSRTTQ